MLSLWQKIFGIEASSASNETAKSRLHFVLVQDRTGLNSEEMANFKQALVDVIDQYFEIDKEGFDISYKREGEETALVINSPVVVKRCKARKSKKKEVEGNTPEEPTVLPA